MNKLNILISGANSELAQPAIRKILNNQAVESLHLITHTSVSIKDSRIKEYVLDLSSLDGLKTVNEKIDNLEISHYLQFHGNAYPNDNLEKITFDTFAKTFNVNFQSTLSIVQGIIPSMVRKKHGRIVLMSTASASHGGGKDSFAYGLSKHSIYYLVRYLAKYYTGDNILTNCVSPGFIKTKFHTEVMQRSDEQLTARAKSVRLGHAGHPEDVANMFYNLAFENEFISGQNINVDGGDFI